MNSNVPTVKVQKLQMLSFDHKLVSILHNKLPYNFFMPQEKKHYTVVSLKIEDKNQNGWKQHTLKVVSLLSYSGG